MEEKERKIWTRYTWKMNRLFANPNKTIRLRNDTLDTIQARTLSLLGGWSEEGRRGKASQVQSPRGKDERGVGGLNSVVEEGGGGKRSLVKNTRVTRSFTRGATSVACWSRRRERERERLLYGWALVSNWILRSRRKRGAAGIVARGLLPSRTCSMRRHFYARRPRTRVTNTESRTFEISKLWYFTSPVSFS